MNGRRDNPGPGPSGSANSLLPSGLAERLSFGHSIVQANLVTGLGLAIMLGVAAAAALLQAPPARAAGAQADSGGALFAQHCASCHQATGLGIVGTFPPLVANPAAVDQEYVETVIRDGLSGPIEVLGVGYDTVMPPVVELTDPGEIQELARYVVTLASQDGAGEATESAGSGSADSDLVADGETDGSVVVDGAAGPVVGDVDRGHDLFIGATRFENGGGACVACHTAGSVDNLGGWSLGPDLTNVYQSLGGEAGLTGWLASPPSPTMRPVFADQPLSEAEVADVVAFLDGAAQDGKVDSGVDRLLVAGLIGLVVLIAGMALTWRGMRQTYVERLRSGGRGHPATKRLASQTKRSPR